MKKLDKKWKIVLFGCGGLGVNMLGIIVSSYLCSALLTGGFAPEDIGLWTYSDQNLVISALWSILVVVAKVLDGIIDLPLASLTDNLRTRWGRRRPAILMGFVPMLAAYLLFLVPATPGVESLANTIWFAVLLCIFYSAYTLTMVSYYATFSEITVSTQDRMLLSTVKSVCDVVYFIFGFALLPVFVGMGINIRFVALMFLPLAATVLIPLLLIKEPSTENGIPDAEDAPSPERVGLFTSIAYAFKHRAFIYWLFVLFVMNCGSQIFLSGINEFFSVTQINMTFVMASAFVPVPFTLILFNKINKRFGFRIGYQYVLLTFAVGMALMGLLVRLCPPVAEGSSPPLWFVLGAMGCGVIVSFAIGAFFSVSYTIPSQLAAEENKKGVVCASSMFFAVQGLFEGVSAGIATGPILVFLKETQNTQWTTLIVAGLCMIAFVMAFFLPKSVANIGKEEAPASAEKAH